MKGVKSILVFALLLSISCQPLKLPEEKYYQFLFKKDHTYQNDELQIRLSNPVMAPLRIWLSTSYSPLQEKFDSLNPIVIQEKQDTLLIFSELNEFQDDIAYKISLGDPSKEIENTPIELPFPKGKSYKVIQGNNTNFTHSSDYSRYALDFKFQVGDTVVSVSDGYVVGVIDQYERGGTDPAWRPYSNFITIYDQESGRFFQYVHLKQNGSLVKVGDQISSGQPIGLSGNTGQTTEPHLHFNCLKPVNAEGEMVSHPVEFVEGYDGKKIKKGDVVRK
ncbi:M23 family metallopeptidase [Algoriphagus kandeliae]|uniref:M23 family metallopeptidase n=1 Tax=Algoriphagus kandeliae TaxID=2562278 RepID=A0A4Y9QNC3_9BACT|nr:M23 family metallopeptidase [Algoriphagus kandeliae]TFV94151.1 M23 family metallopeptidase [Algoriphagus kandeliae]